MHGAHMRHAPMRAGFRANRCRVAHAAVKRSGTNFTRPDP